MEKETRAFESTANDPLNTELYTLANGLKVYISRNPTEPKIVTRVAVRAGSKYDPKDTTGLAHYLEHMLFKGNSQLGTLDWEKERVELKKLSDLYEKRRQTTQADERKKIYAEIDRISQIAAQYAVPNEYDKLMSALGATGTNAYTSNEQTVYLNTIPSTEFEKWAEIESVRFSELALRLFHTELETVYEEFNRLQDNDERKLFFKMNEMLFPTHQYGTQTTIGKGEHLQNPSMENIHAYFDTYYVPNNMALVLTGDVPDNAMEWIEKKFGSWKQKPLPTYHPPQEKPIAQPLEAQVFGPSKESVAIAFRVAPDGTDASDKLTLIDNILINGSAGLLDLNLLQKQRVQSAYSYYYGLQDYGTFTLVGAPLKGQSLDEVKDLLLEQLNKVKNGDFDDWLLEAIINDFKKNQLQSTESNAYRADVLVDLFVKNQSLSSMAQRFERLEKIDKQSIVSFANTCFANNYVVVKKCKGEDSSNHKVEKPNIGSIQLNRNTSSAFANAIAQLPETRLKPLFIDYQKALHQECIQTGFDFFYLHNSNNDLFRLSYVIEMGSKSDPYLALAFSYLKYLGTHEYSNQDLNKEYFRLGLNFDVSVDAERLCLSVSGLQKNAARGAELLEHLLAHAVADQKAYDQLVSSIEKQRENIKTNKNAIHRSAMNAYAKYGKTNPYNDVIPLEALQKTKPEDLIKLLQNIFSYQHLVFYYGPEKKNLVKQKIISKHTINQSLTDLIPPKKYKELDMPSNQVYFTNFDMVQAELRMLSKDCKYNLNIRAQANVFNQYFGSGLSSIVFQEIRESKALAYSAYAHYVRTSHPDRHNYVSGYIGTQADKLNEAVDALQNLMSEMPLAEKQFESAKLSALKIIESSRILNENIFWNFLNLRKQSLKEDTRKAIYEDVKKLTLKDLEQFFNKHIKGKHYHYTVLGNEELIDFDALNRLGKVTKLTTEELFGH